MPTSWKSSRGRPWPAGSVWAATGLRQVVNMSEPLSGGAKELISEAFGLPVTNNYATGECMALSMGCLKGHGMHLQADWAILEVVDHQDEPVPAGQPGEKVLITNLYNTLQPFLRYETEDIVTMSPTPCPCGSPFPLILRVEGRTAEVTWIQAGDRYRQIHPYVFIDFPDEYPGVGWYHIVQVERTVISSAPPGGRGPPEPGGAPRGHSARPGTLWAGGPDPD